MKAFRKSLIGYLLASALFAATPAPHPTPSRLDQQIAALELDVPRLREITKLVATNADQPTKQIHDELWGLLLTRIHADPVALGAEFEKESNEALPVQIAFWDSLRLSAQSHRIVVTREFAALRNNYPKATFTSDYDKVQDAMLSAAATGQPYTFRNGQTAHITVQVAEKTLAGINAMKVRFNRLYDPNWRN